MIGELKTTYLEKHRSHLYGLAAVFAGLRLVLFRENVKKFRALKITEKLFRPGQKHDPLYFVSHAHYLSRGLGLGERVRSAIHHHEYEFRTFSKKYHEEAYKSTGITLWEKNIEDNLFVIKLISNDGHRHEGDLNVVFTVNNVNFWIMSFSYTESDLFGSRSGTTILISRNQSGFIDKQIDSGPTRAIFRNYFGSTLPQYFCLSAVCGIAISNGWSSILGLKHDMQVCYSQNYLGFRDNYTALWEQFGVAKDNDQVYQMPVPLQLRPLDLVKNKSRARKRRANLDDVVQSACARMTAYHKNANIMIPDPLHAADAHI